MRMFITALAVALVLPASALAVTANDEIRARAPHSSLAVQPPPPGRDLRALDQQAPAGKHPATSLSRLFTRGTDVAAPDQQTPVAAVAPRPTPRPVAGDGFDWGDAAIGAAGSLALLTIVAGFGVLGSHRRRGTRQVASIG
jgi:hypothetical protein